MGRGAEVPRRIFGLRSARGFETEATSMDGAPKGGAEWYQVSSSLLGLGVRPPLQLGAARNESGERLSVT
jgi:hypothetical protein